MKRLLLMSSALLLAACATPREACISAVTRDMQVVDKLIAESEANIARGYAWAKVVTTRKDFIDCTPDATAENPAPERQMCLVDVPVETREPVAIDLDIEAAKLDSLRKKRAQQAKAAEAAIASCNARYPE